jgi:uracil-DNA glycosylase family 4
MGEAPGKTENRRGTPFCGKSGELLDLMLKDAMELNRDTFLPTYYIINSVLCRPCNEFQGENREPEPEEVLACKPNVLKEIRIASPKMVIFVGKVAEKYYKRVFPFTDKIQHPAFLLRHGGRMSDWYFTNIRKLAEIFITVRKLRRDL